MTFSVAKIEDGVIVPNDACEALFKEQLVLKARGQGRVGVESEIEPPLLKVGECCAAEMLDVEGDTRGTFGNLARQGASTTAAP